MVSLAVITRIRSDSLRGVVYGSAQRRIAGRCLQPINADGYYNGGSHQNMALQHDEGELTTGYGIIYGRTSGLNMELDD